GHVALEVVEQLCLVPEWPLEFDGVALGQITPSCFQTVIDPGIFEAASPPLDVFWFSNLPGHVPEPGGCTLGEDGGILPPFSRRPQVHRLSFPMGLVESKHPCEKVQRLLDF